MAAVTLESVRAAVVIGTVEPVALEAVYLNAVVFGAPLVWGFVTYDGAPVSRVVSLLAPSSGAFLASGASDPSTGQYALPAFGGQSGDVLVAVAFDEGTGGEGDPVLPHKTQRVVLE